MYFLISSVGIYITWASGLEFYTDLTFNDFLQEAQRNSYSTIIKKIADVDRTYLNGLSHSATYVVCTCFRIKHYHFCFPWPLVTGGYKEGFDMVRTRSQLLKSLL